MGMMEEITEKLKTAMKEKDSITLEAMRAVKSAVKYKKAETGKDPEEADIKKIILKEAKKRRDSIAEFRRCKREDLAEKEEAQLKALEPFLPEEMGDGEIEEIVRAAIEETGAAGKQDIGKIMKTVMPKLQGKADGRKVNLIAARLLTQ